MKLTDERILEVLGAAPSSGLDAGEVARALGLSGAQRHQIRSMLDALARGGAVARQGRRFILQGDDQQQADKVSGILHVTPGGRGFVDLGEAYEDVLVSRMDLGQALDGDTVEIRTWDGRLRRQGQVMEVISRGRTRLTGNLKAEKGGALHLEPDDPRMPELVVVDDAGQARPGQAVLADIIAYPQKQGEPPRVRVTRVLGEPGVLVTEVAKCVAGVGVDETFPPTVTALARSFPDRVDPEEMKHRLDLRQTHFVTIDPRSARDFDDAVALEPCAGGATRVWVAVADVSHYVEEGTPLDQEARARGCSTYLPDRAIHMLPEELSAGICSLVPGEDRLAMVVRLDVDSQGRVTDEECAAAVIHSKGRLDYAGVAAALEGDFRGMRSAYQEHAELLDRLHRLTAALRRARLARGSLDLDLPESEVLLDQDDPCQVREIVESRPDAPIKRAYSLVEELMVAANEAVGRQFRAAGVDTIWRIHPPPARDALNRLSLSVGSYGVEAEPGELGTNRGMGRLLARLQGHRARRPLCYLVLRALKPAVYSTKNQGHFGLASRTYLHFTSPIRRYPDLHVHRLLKGLLRERGGAFGRQGPLKQVDAKSLGAIAREATFCERRSVGVEREVKSLYGASLMREHIGDQEWGTVTGLTRFGVFVYLDEPAVEGLVHAEKLGRTVFDPDSPRLFDRDSGRVFSLGDRALVQVTDASVRRRRVDLALVPGKDNYQGDPDFRGEWPRAGGRGRGSKGRGGREDRRARGREGGRGRRRSQSPAPRKPGGRGPRKGRR